MIQPRCGDLAIPHEVKPSPDPFDSEIEFRKHDTRIQGDIKALGEFIRIAQLIGPVQKLQEVRIEFEANGSDMQKTI